MSTNRRKSDTNRTHSFKRVLFPEDSVLVIGLGCCAVTHKLFNSQTYYFYEDMDLMCTKQHFVKSNITSMEDRKSRDISPTPSPEASPRGAGRPGGFFRSSAKLSPDPYMEPRGLISPTRTAGRCKQNFFRENVATKEYVVYCIDPTLVSKPHQYAKSSITFFPDSYPKHDSACPFCVGNEHLCPKDLLCYPASKPSESDSGASSTVGSGSASATGDSGPVLSSSPVETLSSSDSDSSLSKKPLAVETSEKRTGASPIRESSWDLRVISNKYPVVSDQELGLEALDVSALMHFQLSAAGFHDVFIESSLHNASIPTLSPSEASIHANRLLRAICERAKVYKADPRVHHITVFKNHGPLSGGSLVHPHTQAIAVPFVPHEVALRIDCAREYFQEKGCCVYCAMLRFDLEKSERIVWKSEKHVVVVPFAAQFPYHMWVMPLEHSPDFFSQSEDDLQDLADALSAALRALCIALKGPSWNFSIQSCPIREYEDVKDHFHWYIDIVPRLYSTSGFEYGSKIRINWNLPEEDAKFLKQSLLKSSK